MPRILVTGAGGQIGSDLVRLLRDQHSRDAVLATDLRPLLHTGGPSDVLDVRNADRLRLLSDRHGIDTVYHLASLLSATGEQQPHLAWDVNMNGLRHVLEVARERSQRVFWPSSIAAFGPTTPRDDTPQTTVLEPTTMYGLTKVSGELLCQYYALKFSVDVRSVRYPGLISSGAPPGGGTTDYAVDMFRAAVRGDRYTCFVSPETVLPMMYMPDALRGTVALMAAPADAITVRTSYNFTALSFSASELADAIRDRVPDFELTYQPDFRQGIADTWPRSVDDSQARRDWGWSPEYDLPGMVGDMLARLSPRLHAARTSR
ncbi:MAG: NAD-dependent epimerase/dehydratase family protein [Bacteroidota bacterium]